MHTCYISKGPKFTKTTLCIGEQNLTIVSLVIAEKFNGV